ncbi:MAG: IMP cyclohydrolase [Spirochaetales bacterium]|uniref:IMP cyclohydrolase n=1 Tax=Candidatus Thalassospirochaeta sargassi TaxID=3119039 RepID=A0AAJ1IFR1_9SPIO|nr:IMP cyclohydrolase [Spirochaetales bacterium]
MSDKKLSSMYSRIIEDLFPANMEITFHDNGNNRQTLFYEKALWTIDGESKGLRYGENPDQEAALYKLVNGNLTLGEVSTILPGQYLASDVELVQSGKHPGKTNITDIDNSLNILRYFSDEPVTVIVKHNNPCGVARGTTLAESYIKALMADRIAAFGGAIAVNKPLDKETAELIIESYSEVVAAPEFEAGVIDILSKKKNLRVMKVGNISRLHDFVGRQFVDFKSLIDGGLVAQWSFVPKASEKSFLPAVTEYKGKEYRVNRQPTAAEMNDMIFGWLIESGITSNSVIYVKDGVTVGIGTGEQDRVGVAEIARDKAYRKFADKICYEEYKTPLSLMKDPDVLKDIDKRTAAAKGGIKDSVMVSDAFFPFRDGIEVGLNEGVTAVIQPGGSLRDFESIEACNEKNAAMIFTGQRSFKH